MKKQISLKQYEITSIEKDRKAFNVFFTYLYLLYQLQL